MSRWTQIRDTVRYRLRLIPSTASIDGVVNEFRVKQPGELEIFLRNFESNNQERRLRFFKSLSDYFWENGPVEYALLPSELYLEERRHLYLLFRASEIYGIRGDREERRIGYLEEAVQCDATNATDYLVIALALTRLRRWDEAIRAYEDGLNLWPADAELWRGYAESAIVSKTIFVNFVKYIEKHSAKIADMIATLSPHSAVYFIKHLKSEGESIVCDRITDLIIQRLVKGNLEDAIEQAKSYIANSVAWNDFDFRDRFCKGIIERWSRRDGEEFARAVFRLKLQKLFWLPLVFQEIVNDEELVRDFCSACQKLSLEAIELNDPVADLGPACIPWQAIYTRAVPHLYSTAALAIHNLCARVWPRLTWTAPHVGRKHRPNNEKIKIGFTCLDFMPMISGLMGKLDAGKFEKIYLRPTPPGPVSETGRNWVARADRTVGLPADSVYAVQEAIAREQLDVIVAGPSLPMSIYPMMARLAPLQMTIIEPNWCDQFSNLDYYISWDNAEPSNFKTYHKSAVALMRHPPYWVEMPSQAKKPVATVGRVLANAPVHKRVYLCPTQPAKLHPTFDEVVRKVLLRDPEGIVVFLRMDNSVGDSVQYRMKKSLGPLAQRAVFLPALKPEEAHAFLNAVDCVLDAYPLGGMSSSFVATAVGTPTVSLPAEMPFGKWMSAIYNYIGVEGLTARSPDEYSEIAYRLASDAQWREKKASEIRAKRNLLIENEASAAEFEEFLLSATKRHADGLRPTHWVNGQWAEN